MMLSDGAIRERLKHDLIIDPMPADDCFQPASVDLTLGSTVCWYLSGPVGPDIKPDVQEAFIGDNGIVLSPGDFVLGVTRELVQIPHDLACRVEGKSSLGRMGLLVHVTAGFIDPGFRGRITLELKNLNHAAGIRIKPGMKISQIAFMELTDTAVRPYGSAGLSSKYQGSGGVVPYKMSRKL